MEIEEEEEEVVRPKRMKLRRDNIEEIGIEEEIIGTIGIGISIRKRKKKKR